MPSDLIVILTGAGISKESGLDTFRCSGGLWSQVRLEDVATPEAFARDPATVQAFYNARRRGLLDPAIKPNPAHDALARLEREYPGDVLLITQNIDDLHERAGSRNVIHMHGELLKIRCQACGTITSRSEDVSVEEDCQSCGRTGSLRPHVVWFGEMPLEMERIYAALEQCGQFIAIGTSGSVYPAAGFVNHVMAHGDGETVELNLEPSDGASFFDRAVHGPASRVVPRFVGALLDGLS